MYEPSCCQPCADKYRAQIHELDGITVEGKKKKKVMYTDIYHSFLLCTCIKLYILDWKILMMISEQNQAP